MHWIEEPSGASPEWPDQVLLTEEGEPLGPAWVEFWKRILTDGHALAPASRFTLAIDIYARTFEADSTGQATAKFRNSLNRQAEGIGSYGLQSDHLTLLQGKNEDDTAFGRRQLVWLLDHYKELKAALRSGDVWPLYERINSFHPLPVRLATINGWFDMQIGQEGFGTLPYEDQELLAGMEPKKEDPMEALTRGVIISPRTTAVEEFTDALIHYTPPHFKTIRCTIKEDVEQGERAIFYEIECPEFPDEGTTVVNDRVHRAATLLVQQLAAEHGTFAGVKINLILQQDDSWQRSIELVGR